MVKRYPMDEKWLRHQVQQLDRPHHEIAAELNLSRSCIGRWCKRLGIAANRTGPKGGSRHPEWKGGRNIDKDGYVLIHRPEHPDARKNGYVLEHRLNMESHLGRRLHSDEVVHHIDRNKQNNHISNLVLYSSNADHLRDELKSCPIHKLCVGCKSERTAILHSLAGGDPLPPPTTDRWKARFARSVQRACGGAALSSAPIYGLRGTATEAGGRTHQPNKSRLSRPRRV